MFLEVSSFLMLLSMFACKIPLTSIKFIKFHLQGLIFRETHNLSERYTIM